MPITRRALLGSAAAGGLTAGGIYALVDRLTGSPKRPAAGEAAPEQHLLQGVRIVEDNGVEDVVPPLHHQAVTATVKVGRGERPLVEAQEGLENAIPKLERRFGPTSACLG